MKTDNDVVGAFLAMEPASSGNLESEIRKARTTTDPRSGQPTQGLSSAVLWCGEQPVAASVGGVVLLNRAARNAEYCKLVAEEAASRGREVQQVREPDLWRLAA